MALRSVGSLVNCQPRDRVRCCATLPIRFDVAGHPTDAARQSELSTCTECSDSSPNAWIPTYLHPKKLSTPLAFLCGNLRSRYRSLISYSNVRKRCIRPITRVYIPPSRNYLGQSLRSYPLSKTHLNNVTFDHITMPHYLPTARWCGRCRVV